MLDRKTPPTYHQLTDIKLQLAEQRHLRKGVPLHVINAGKQEVVRLEAIFRAGSIHENKKGQAFLTAKMLSEGTAAYSAREIASILDSHGAHLDIVAGFDSCTVSLYTLTKHLPVVLPVLRSMLTEPVFPDKELDTLKDIKKQKLRVDNNKNAVVASKQFRKLLFSGHPYGNFLVESDLDPLNSEDLLLFFQHYFYQNFELFVSGAVSLEVEKQIADSFDDIPYQELQEVNVAPVSLQSARQENIPKKESLQSSIRTGRHLFNLHHPDFNRFSVLNTLFGGYFGSRLMKSIREEKGYTYGIYSNVVPMRRAGYLVIGTDVIGEFTKQTLEEIHNQTRNLREVPVEADELETVKNYMLGSFLSGLNSPFALADQYKTIYLNQLPLDHFDRYIKEINLVSAEDLQSLAQTYLVPEKFSTVVIGDVQGFESN